MTSHSIDRGNNLNKRVRKEDINTILSWQKGEISFEEAIKQVSIHHEVPRLSEKQFLELLSAYGFTRVKLL